MQQVNDFVYKVNLHEQVKIQIVPSQSLGLGQFVANLDGHDTEPVNSVYAFTVNRPVSNPPKSHFFIIVFSFNAASDGSQYLLKIDGDATNSKGPFDVTVEKDEPNHDKTFRFIVTA